MFFRMVSNTFLTRFHIARLSPALRLTEAILPHTVELKTTAIGRRIMQRVYKRYPHLEHQAPPEADPPVDGTPPAPANVGGMPAAAFPSMQ